MTIESIIQGCQNGSAEARKELYERYAGVMFSLVRRYIRVRATAEDVFHDGFVALFTKIGDYRGDGHFEGWMRRIFINTALSHLRREGSSMAVDEDVSDLPPSSVGGASPEALGRMEDKELLGLVERLPEGYRMVLMLHTVEGYSHAEIAKMLSISEATSRSQLLRAKVRLKEMIESQDYNC